MRTNLATHEYVLMQRDDEGYHGGGALKVVKCVFLESKKKMVKKKKVCNSKIRESAAMTSHCSRHYKSKPRQLNDMNFSLSS